MTELMSYQDLKNTLLSIGNTEHRAFLCSVYAGMARVGEIVRGRGKKTQPFLCRNIISLANKTELHLRTEKSHKMRKVPLFRNRENWLCEIIEGWKNLRTEGPMFPYTTRWGELTFKKYFPEFTSNRGQDKEGSKHTIHWLRGWRYTHYKRGEVTGSKVEAKVASLLGGWVSSAVPDRVYDFTEIEDYEDVLENA